MYRIGLAMLVRDRGKYLGIVAGIAFAALLINQQAGIFLGIMRRSYSAITDIAYPDIWVMDHNVDFVDNATPLGDTQLQRVRGVAGVRWAVPLYRDELPVRPAGGRFETCVITGIDDQTLIGGPPVMVKGRLEDLRRQDAVIVDETGAAGELARTINGKSVPLDVGDSVDINDHQATVVGICRVSTVFEAQPVVYMMYSRAVAIAPPQRQLLTFVLVKARDGVDPVTLCDSIRRATGLAALTRRQFQNMTWNWYFDYTGIPINFGISVLLGFFVGLAVAGKTFYNFILENLRSIGTLMAMGTSQDVLMRMVLIQAGFAGAIGYGIGLGLAAACGLWLRQQGTLAFVLSWPLVVDSAVAIGFISLVSAASAVWRLRRLEPAIVFRA
jgi:putative ABC transport system permease protein